MSIKHILAVGALALVASAYACGQATGEDAEEAGGAFVGFKGSVDQAGIVEVTTIMLTTGSNPLLDSSLDSFNQEDPFALPDGFRTAFASNLAKFDAIDGKTDWTPAQSAAWLKRLASNYQVLDTSKPCDYANQHSYLEIERALLTGRPHQTCGGRPPNEDTLDVTFDFLARGPAADATEAQAFGDGIAQAAKLSTDTFPYLAEID